jgi:hypothetical protein
MDVQEIIAKARAADVPNTWNVWPLRRGTVARDVATWALISGVGLLLFIPALRVMVPDNFERGATSAIVSLIILFVLGFMAFGALYLLIVDGRRLRLSGEYLLIMTPDDFVKVEPRRITRVPMDQIDSITLKGVRAPRDEAAEADPRPVTERVMGLFARKPKESPMLAFRDLRTNTDVIVSRDNAFDELPALAYMLEMHVDAKERSRRKQGQK